MKNVSVAANEFKVEAQGGYGGESEASGTKSDAADVVLLGYGGIEATKSALTEKRDEGQRSYVGSIACHCRIQRRLLIR